MPILMKALLLSVAFLAFSHQAFGVECVFESRPQIIEDTKIPRRHLVMWEESSDRVMKSENLPSTATFVKHRSAVQILLSTDPYFLLKRYLDRAARPEDAHNI